MNCGKKKIALIPLLYNEYNYGGVLQFFALQKKLVDAEYDVCILQVNDEEKLFKEKRNIKGYIFLPLAKFLSYIKRKKIDRRLIKRYLKIDSFKKYYYAKTENIKKTKLGKYYAFICGSDQIWNPQFARKRNFLTFAPSDSRKIIYAASLGAERLDDYCKKTYKELIKKISFVSVREYSAKKILDEFCERKDIEVVADPTLLLKPNEWDMLTTNPGIDNKYLFIYMLGEISDWHKDIITKYARDYDMEIVRISFASGERIDNISFGDREIIDASPELFLSLIKHSDCIFTDSFHACVFSILFRKTFYVFKRDNNSKMMGRIETLFNHFNISSRIITNELPKGIIDYSFAEEAQDKLIEKSVNFLKKALGETNHDS